VSVVREFREQEYLNGGGAGGGGERGLSLRVSVTQDLALRDHSILPIILPDEKTDQEIL